MLPPSCHRSRRAANAAATTVTLPPRYLLCCHRCCHHASAAATAAAATAAAAAVLPLLPPMLLLPMPLCPQAAVATTKLATSCLKGFLQYLENLNSSQVFIVLSNANFNL
jgi:hypothetical protein